MTVREDAQMSQSDCATCANTGWICAAYDKPADLDGNGCCSTDGLGCMSANGCRDCGRSIDELSISDDVFTRRTHAG